MKTKLKFYFIILLSITLTRCSSIKNRFETVQAMALEKKQLKSTKTDLVENKIEPNKIEKKTYSPQNNVKIPNVNLSEVNLNEVNLDKEFINDNSIENFSGEFKIQDGQLVFFPDDCSLKESGILLKDINGKDFKSKNWLKMIKKSDNKIVDQVTITGVKAPNAPVIFVKKATIPLKPRKLWSSGTASLYCSSAQELYQKTIKLKEDYNLFSVSIEEVEDPTLGKITEYTLYDSKCNKLSPDEIKKMSDKELNGLNNSLKIGGGLLLKQAALTGLAALTTKEIASAGMLDKALMGKDAVTAGIFQAAIVAQLPKIVKNLEESKKYIEQLRGE